MRALSRDGRGSIILSIVFFAYSTITAKNKAKAARREWTVAGGGISPALAAFGLDFFLIATQILRTPACA